MGIIANYVIVTFKGDTLKRMWEKIQQIVITKNTIWFVCLSQSRTPIKKKPTKRTFVGKYSSSLLQLLLCVRCLYWKMAAIRAVMLLLKPESATPEAYAKVIIRLGIIQLVFIGLDVAMFFFQSHGKQWLFSAGIAGVVALSAFLAGITVRLYPATFFVFVMIIRFGVYFELDMYEWLQEVPVKPWTYAIQVLQLLFCLLFLVFACFFFHKVLQRADNPQVKSSEGYLSEHIN